MIRDFDFVQSCEAYSIDLNPGMFKFEAWGAAGGGGDNAGKGGYSSGVLTLREKTKFLVYVGGKGTDGGPIHQNINGGCNGGGSGGKNSGEQSAYNSGSGGGGATDFRLSTSVDSRVLVAGGGGGTCGLGNTPGGYGGGIQAGNAVHMSSIAYGGNQTYGNKNGIGSNGRDALAFYRNGTEGNGGCGGGYRGGTAPIQTGQDSDVGGSGGSSYVSGHKECSSFDGIKFRKIEIKGGYETFLTPTGQIVIGNSDNGFARITHLGSIQCTKCSKSRLNFAYFYALLVVKWFVFNK